jgi:hypothetical protein
MSSFIPDAPEHIVLELRPELRQFRSVITEMDMPTVDMDVALSKLFDALSDDGCEAEVNWVANDMAQGEGLFENSEIDDDGRSRVYGSVVQLGEAIYNRVAELAGYRNGTFPYEFKGMLNHDTVVLSKIREFSLGDPRDRNPEYFDPCL